MMRSEKEIFELLEGIIAEEKSSVACGITIQRMKSEAEPEAIRTAFSLEAAIKSHITELWTVVDVVFDDCLHYDYLQMLAVCEDYVELQKGKPLERMSLVLTLTPLGEYDFFFAGVDGFWAYYTDKATEPCHGLRFIFWKEQFAGYELKPGAVEEMIAGAIDELHFSISANEALNSCLNF